MYRPEGWHNPYNTQPYEIEEREKKSLMYEVGADAMLEALKKKALYGKCGRDFMIAGKVKPDDKDWAKSFLDALTDDGWLIFIPNEEGEQD